MSSPCKKKIPPLDPSLTEFNAYYKGNDGNWYLMGQITEDDRDPKIPESVVAEAVYKWKQTRRRQVNAKLRKRGFVEAEPFAKKKARQHQPQAPFAIDIEVIAHHPDLGAVRSVYKGLVKEYLFLSLEPETDPYANVRLCVVSRGTSKAFTRKFNKVVSLPSVPK